MLEGLMVLLAACHDRWDAPDRSGDPVDLLDHGLQVAAVLRASHPDDLELQAAGLVHDVGHAVVPGDEAGHGEHGARVIEPFLGPRVARLVELHIPAKRYLATVEAYALSPESLRTLELQGGLMSAAEVAAFEADPDAAAAVALRRADDLGKVVGLSVPGLESWRPVLARVAAGR